MTDHDYRRVQHERILRLQEFADSQSREITKLREHAESEADVIAGLRDDLGTARRELDRQRAIAFEHEGKAVRLVLQLESTRRDLRQLRQEVILAVDVAKAADCHCGLCKPTILPFSR